MADNGADFRARAAALAAKARATSPQTADVAGVQADTAPFMDAASAENAQRMDDAYARRGIGGPLAAGAAMDATLQNAALKQQAYRSSVAEALRRRRSGISAAYQSASAQEGVNEAERRLEEERRRREAALIGDLLGTAGMVGGFAVGGPVGAAVGGAAGRTAGRSF